MNRPLSICLEDCYPAHESLRFLQCTAAAGPGHRLHLTRDGKVAQQEQAEAWCRIFVTTDGRLAALRDVAAPAGARVTRAGRHADLQPGKPVLLLDGDFLAVPGHCYRLHVHGDGDTVRPPEFLHAKEPAAATWARVAACGLIAFTGFAGAVSCARETTVNEKPADGIEQPVPLRPDPPKDVEPTRGKVDPIDVRDDPPEAPADPNY